MSLLQSEAVYAPTARTYPVSRLHRRFMSYQTIEAQDSLVC